MALTEDTRSYSFSDGELVQKTDKLLLNIQRDAAEFATRGVTPASVQALKTMRDDFDDYPTDPELLGVEKQATIIKADAETALREQLTEVRDIANDKYKGRGLYTSFGFKGMDSFTDDNLHRLAKRVVRVGTSLFGELSGNGLTADILKSVAEKDKKFDDAIDEQQAAVETRDIATQTRVRMGNALYAEGARLSAIGKSLFAKTDEAKYNDYVMLDAAPAAVQAVAPVA